MVQLAEISWEKARTVFDATDVVLIPVGSTEQHGPHNPLGTDHLLAEAVAKAVGDNTGVPVTPIVPVGISEHHRQFTGSLWVSPEVFKEYMIGIALSSSYHGASKIVFVNGHGGNTSAILEICENLRRQYDLFACIVHSYPPSMTGGHAGTGETSQNLYFHPELVDMSKAVDTEQKQHLGPFKMAGYNSIGPARFPWDTIDLTDTGVLGAAGTLVTSKDASVEKGREMMEPHINAITDFVNTLKEADLDKLLCKSDK